MITAVSIIINDHTQYNYTKCTQFYFIFLKTFPFVGQICKKHQFLPLQVLQFSLTESGLFQECRSALICTNC